MKKLYLAFTLTLIGLYSCSTSAEQPVTLQPIEQLQAYVKNNTGYSFSIVDSLEYMEAKVYRAKMI